LGHSFTGYAPINKVKKFEQAWLESDQIIDSTMYDTEDVEIYRPQINHGFGLLSIKHHSF